MKYAAYVGRVGALAVALGIGTGVADAPGVAWAEPGSSSSSESGSGDAGAKGPGDAQKSSDAAGSGVGGASGDAGRGPDAAESDGSADRGRAGSRRSAAKSEESARSGERGGRGRGAGDPGSAVRDGAGVSSGSSADAAGPGAGKTRVDSSGGGHPSGSAAADADPAEATGDGVGRPGVADPGPVGSDGAVKAAEPSVAEPPPAASAQPQRVLSVDSPAASVDSPPAASVEPRPAAVVEPAPMAAADPVSSSPSDLARGAPVGGRKAGSNNGRQAVDNPADALRVDADKHSAAASAAASRPQPAQPAGTTVNTSSVQQSDLVVSQTAPVAAAAQSEAPAAAPGPVSRVVAKTLAWAGLNTSQTGSPVAPVESPAQLALLAAWRRQSQQARAGEAPTDLADVARTGQPVDPTVTGKEAVADLSTMQLAPVSLVAAAVADAAAPTVNLTSPPAGPARGAVNLAAAAADDVGVEGVQFLVNGAPYGAEVRGVDITGPYSGQYRLTVNTTAADNGTYAVAARARDAAGNTTTTPAASITVDNTVPSVSLTGPANGATVSGNNVTLSATASDNVGVAGVKFFVDGAMVGAEDPGSPYSVSWNTTTVGNGSHTVTAQARDAAGNTTTTAARSVTVSNIVADTTAPTVSLTAPPAGPARGAVILAATAADNAGGSGVAGVQFFANGAPLLAEDTSSPYGITVPTTAADNGSYTLTARARDAAGNTRSSAPVSITVDNTAPTVSLTSPAAGSTVSGSVDLTATASDNVAVAGVKFLVDGVELGAEDPAAPYGPVSWNTATVSNGTHTLTAQARDTAGNTTTTAARNVTVTNVAPDTTAPTVSLTAPASGATVSGTVTLTATAADNVGVAGVKFFVDGTLVDTEDPSSPYSVSWNTTTVGNGMHTVTAQARDAAGNTTDSAVGVTVSNNADTTAPTVSFTGPAEGATVSGIVNLTATASDNVGVARVQFFWGRPSGGAVNLELLAEDTTAPYGPVFWDSATAVNGPNRLFVQALDAAGNSTMRSINVIVNNPANNLAPVVPGKTIPGGPDPVTGVVTGRMNVRDPEQAQLSYTLAYPPSRGGTVSFDQPTGVFTYTPSQAARDQAAGTSGLDYDTFGVSISDGIATVQTSVTVQVAQTLPPTTSITNTPVTAGSGPSGAAVAGGFAYVINYDSNNVTVFDTATNQFVKTLDVGTGPLSVAASPQGNRVYVSNSLSNSVSVIDATTNTVISTPIRINVLPGSYYNPEVSYEPLQYPNRVTEVAASGNRLYVNATDGRITVIDTSNDVNQVIRTDAPGTFQDLKVSPDGTRLYGTHWGGVTVINTSTMTAAAIPIGPAWNSELLRNEYINSVGNVALRPDGKRAYVTFGATIAERAVGGQSYGSFFTTEGLTWMVTGGYSGVAVIDTDPTSGNFNTEIARVIVPLGVHDLAVSGSSLYVTSGDGRTVTVINTANNALTGRFTTDQTASGGRAIAITVNPYGDLPEWDIPVLSVTAFTRYVTVGPTGTVYITDYTDGQAYAVTVGSSSV